MRRQQRGGGQSGRCAVAVQGGADAGGGEGEQRHGTAGHADERLDVVEVGELRGLQLRSGDDGVAVGKEVAEQSQPVQVVGVEGRAHEGVAVAVALEQGRGEGELHLLGLLASAFAAAEAGVEQADHSTQHPDSRRGERYQLHRRHRAHDATAELWIAKVCQTM